MKIPEQKVILCGEFGVGKSSLFRRFMNDTFTTATDRKSTMGLDHYGKVYNIKGKGLKLQFEANSRKFAWQLTLLPKLVSQACSS